jgi:hypothetical protein
MKYGASSLHQKLLGEFKYSSHWSNIILIFIFILYILYSVHFIKHKETNF